MCQCFKYYFKRNEIYLLLKYTNTVWNKIILFLFIIVYKQYPFPRLCVDQSSLAKLLWSSIWTHLYYFLSSNKMNYLPKSVFIYYKLFIPLKRPLNKTTAIWLSSIFNWTLTSKQVSIVIKIQASKRTMHFVIKIHFSRYLRIVKNQD